MGRLRPEWSEKAGGAESPRSLFAEFGEADAEGDHTTEGSGAEGLDLPN